MLQILDIFALTLYNTIDILYPSKLTHPPVFRRGEGGGSPGLRHNMNRKRFFLALALGIALVLVCVSAALAASPIKVSMELKPTKLSGPQTITVAITVTNVGDGDLPGPVTLYYPNGKRSRSSVPPRFLSVQTSAGRVNGPLRRANWKRGKLPFRSGIPPMTANRMRQVNRG